MIISKLLHTAIFLLVSFSISAAPLFENDEVIEIELVGPISNLIENKEVLEEVPFVLRADGADHQIKIRLRGKSRLRVCDFPPLRFNLNSNQSALSQFEGQDRLKLVTHCRNDARFEKNVLEEYAAYRIFSLISEVAYRVRLLHISYTDTDGRLDEEEQRRFGFVIEPSEHLAARLGGELVQETGVRLGQLNTHQAALVYVFQYLIGNTDWSLVLADGDDYCCHNGDLLEIAGEIYYVPYDFDLSGIVNADYAKPDPSLRLRNVRQRRYRGFCTDRDDLQKAIQQVKSRETDIFTMVRGIAGLTRKEVSAIEIYLSQFFEKAGDEEKLLKKYEKTCID